MTDLRIDVLASHSHYLDHIAPVWRALPEEVQGDVFITRPVLRAHPLVQEADGKVRTARNTRRVSRVLVAGSVDAKLASRNGWGVALMEHGAGQSYNGGKRSSSYAGGPGRESIGLFLCTNEGVKSANDRLNGRRSVVIGSPRLHDLSFARALHEPSGPPTLALAWHWPCTVAPESFWLLPEFRSALMRLRTDWRGDIIGHAHPKGWRWAVQAYREVGIEPVRDWHEVVMRADVVSFDNTSVGFEAAALGIPVVLLESMQWRRDVEHGLRFWRWSDIGPVVRDDTYPEALARKWIAAAVSAMTDRDVYAPRIAAMRAEVYPYVEDAAERAARELCAWIGSPSCA